MRMLFSTVLLLLAAGNALAQAAWPERLITMIVVRADSPWRTLREFVEDLRARPAAYNYGSSGKHIQAGKLRALAHWGERPVGSLPGVPSLRDAGYPVKFAQWSALFVPAATPDDIVRRLRAAAAMVKAVRAVGKVQ